MATALAGIIALQLYWISDAMDLSNDNFKTAVRQAMIETSQRLEQEEIRSSMMLRSQRGLFQNNIPSNRSNRHSNITIDSINRAGQRSVTIRRSNKREDVSVNVTMGDGYTDSVVMIHRHRQDTISQGEEAFQWTAIEEELQRSGQTYEQFFQLIQYALQDFNMNPSLPIEQRINPQYLDTLLGISLKKQGVNIDHDFMVMGSYPSRVTFESSESHREALVNSPYRVQLFAGNQTPTPSFLHLYFPNQNFHALQNVWPMALGALLFTAIILVCFFIVIRTIMRQKKISEMKNDFINNMTHEFKTPLATISLATDAMQHSARQQNEERLDYYANIIKEENKRMDDQVERVLQLAQSQTQLKLSKLNVHGLILKAVEKIKLHVEKRGGYINVDLNAFEAWAEVDEVHFSNLISNLLENANKYSPESPQISLSTWNENDKLCISISDQGMGISKANQEKIFDKFFRVSTGNLHDVKGFGLGLSYVKEMVQAHEGEISLQSKPGKGSTFTVKVDFKM